jgi:cytidine deaminase
MRRCDLTITLTEYVSVEELNETDRRLYEAAGEAARSAYAPYSLFCVGAAVLLENDLIVTGNNQENIAYPSGLCAERIAVFTAASNYPDVPVKAIAIAAHLKNPSSVTALTPCGACRQVLAEYEMKHRHPIRVIMMAEKGKILVSDNIGNLLPYTFNAGELKKTMDDKTPKSGDTD